LHDCTKCEIYKEAADYFNEEVRLALNKFNAATNALGVRQNQLSTAVEALNAAVSEANTLEAVRDGALIGLIACIALRGGVVCNLLEDIYNQSSDAYNVALTATTVKQAEVSRLTGDVASIKADVDYYLNRITDMGNEYIKALENYNNCIADCE
jgi:peptidoglycan hydrolase CwlO-like protein